MGLTNEGRYEQETKRYQDAREYGKLGIDSGVIIGVIARLILFVFDEQVAKLYNTNPEVIELTKQFIYYAIFFQLADAFGAPIQGALRGYKDVNVTFVISLVSYWVIGLPSGW